MDRGARPITVWHRHVRTDGDPARGALRIGEDFRHESVLDTTFVGRIEAHTAVGSYPVIVPTISGTGWITGFAPVRRRPDRPAPGRLDSWRLLVAEHAHRQLMVE